MVVADGGARPGAGSRSTSAPRPSTATTARSWSVSPDAALLDRVAELVERARRRAPQRRRGAAGAGRRARARARARRSPTPIAPEHLELAFAGADEAAARARVAGCVFVGAAARPPSATTPRAPTTCCRPAAPRASAGRSGPGRSCAGPPSSPSRRRGRGAGARTSRRWRGAEGFPVHGESAEARDGLSAR